MTTYASIADLRGILTQVGTDAGKEIELQRALDSAHEIATGLLGFEFAAYPTTATAKDVRARGGEWLWLPSFLAGSVTSVYAVYGRGLDAETTYEIDDFVAESDGRLYHDYGWSPRVWYRVTAKWGYGPAPYDAIQLELQIAVNLWRTRDAASGQYSVGVEGQGSVPAARAVTWDVRNLADLIRSKYLGVVHA